MTVGQCPSPSFVVPRLSGHIFRTYEYPESGSAFEKEGLDQDYLLTSTQATKIGRETFLSRMIPANLAMN